MKRKLFTVLLLLLIIPSIAFAAETVDFTITGVCDYSSAYKVLDIVNEERQNQGLQPLSMNEELLDAAMQRAAEIAFSYYPAHYRPDGSSWYTVVEDFPAYAKGENIATGQENAEIVMNAWMNSEGHRNNILNGNYNTIGVGCFYQRDLGRRTWVQIFTSSVNGAGYIVGGEHEETFTITALSDRFDVTGAYNPSASDNGIKYYTNICPGKTEEFRIIEQETYEYGEYPTAIPDMDNFSFKALTDNITVDGHNVTVLSEGEAVIDIYIKGIKVGRHKFIAGHDFRYNSVSKQPTCTQDGYENRKYCRSCGYVDEGSVIPALGHDYKRYVYEVTCIERGYEHYRCKRCEHRYVDEASYIPALGHDYKRYVYEVTCIERGYEHYRCKRCEHRYVDEASYIPALGHDYERYVQVATCTEIGYEHYRCKRCEHQYIDEASYVPAFGHDYERCVQEATCTERGFDGDECSICNERNGVYTPALGHDYERCVQEATCTERGFDGDECSVCNERNGVYTPALGHLSTGHYFDPVTHEIHGLCERCYERVYIEKTYYLDYYTLYWSEYDLDYSYEQNIMRLKEIYNFMTEAEKEELEYEEELLTMIHCYDFYHSGDANFDGVIDSEDLSILLSWYSAQYYMYDIVGDDDIINSDDLSMMLSNYGKER